MFKLKNASTTWRDKLTHAIQMATYTRNSNMKDVFVDPVKQSSKNFSRVQLLWKTLPKAESKPTAPSNLYIPRLVPNSYGFGMEYSLKFMSIH